MGKRRREVSEGRNGRTRAGGWHLWRTHSWRQIILSWLLPSALPSPQPGDMISRLNSGLRHLMSPAEHQRHRHYHGQDTKAFPGTSEAWVCPSTAPMTISYKTEALRYGLKGPSIGMNQYLVAHTVSLFPKSRTYGHRDTSPGDISWSLMPQK